MAFKFSDGQSEITGDFSKLEKLIEELDANHSVDVGVFSDAKTADGVQVAEYGAYNEFGSIVVKDRPPKRSFIRMPIEQKQDKIGAYVSGKAKAHLESGDVKAVFQDIGIAAESVIQEAFDTQGFGSWAPDADSTVARKGSSTPMIDDGTLRKAITHRVNGGKE
jgi:hypothetical protein